MSKYDAVLFDLDGTLTDSSLGITKCAALALDHYGIAYESLDALRVFIGPPLRVTFPKFGVKEEDVGEAIAIFRGRYNVEGKFENVPYDGIELLLQKLQKAGKKLYVATSKPEATAIQILEKFNLSQYFDIIAGATKDASRDTKDAVIRYLLEQSGETGKAVMVGDTAFDVEGANAHQMPCIGVSWGFGTVESMQEEGACAIARTPEELYRLLTEE